MVARDTKSLPACEPEISLTYQHPITRCFTYLSGAQPRIARFACGSVLVVGAGPTSWQVMAETFWMSNDSTSDEGVDQEKISNLPRSHLPRCRIVPHGLLLALAQGRASSICDRVGESSERAIKLASEFAD
jgi:hypothetical protein